MDVATLTTSGDNSLLKGLRTALEGADTALLCVAFVQKAGVHLLHGPLQRLGARARLLHTTVFNDCTGALAMTDDLGADVSTLNPGSGTYHPKVYLARHGQENVVVIGSANLTGGLMTNVEAAIMLRGLDTDPPIKAAWEFAESLWADPRRNKWTGAAPDADEEFSLELLMLLREAVRTSNGQFLTLGASPKPNHVHEVTPAGIYVETEASKQKGSPPQLIPAWMFTLAWDYLRGHGQLSNRFLLADDGLNVKRSSAVCAVLARLPGVVATNSREEGIVLHWGSG